jgi:hypothetical protein
LFEKTEECRVVHLLAVAQTVTVNASHLKVFSKYHHNDISQICSTHVVVDFVAFFPKPFTFLVNWQGSGPTREHGG